MEYKHCTIDLEHDDFDENPREMFDNFGTLCIYHRSYSFGDKNQPDRDEAMAIARDKANYFSLPVYMYEHGNVALSTGSFADPWDSGCVGMIYVSKADIRKEWKVKRISPKLKAIALKNLECEVKQMHSYVSGEIYNYTVKNEAGDTVDSCGGFYGYEEAESEARRAVDYYRQEHPYKYVEDIFSGEELTAIDTAEHVTA